MDRGSKVGVWNEQNYSKFIITYCHAVISRLSIEAAKLVFGMSNNTLVYNNKLSCWFFMIMDRGSKAGVWNEQYYSKFIITNCHVGISGLWIEAAKLVFGNKQQYSNL